ncbi:hypothetical protein Ssi03_62400 [Sphaerisporangium siamense]|uniref:Phage/plasmid-like protein (TIGR03299 family) n=1 Tax=Sphaerisporangium siamense TaxID=795645 RepID=A0A7W7GB94_9ACTN|nr:DUF932 domain-containing protein [Sphaerisporangium siamense]MBB4702550.1 phage/plasmid-like protein (TIGR03299 family) [Sphaerisporangium siamense]GII88250.1 hypothetical protein Ssi03_62400 [Sphaerisporangium siamense]
MALDVNQQFYDQRRAQMERFGSTRRADGTWTGAGFDAYEVIGRDGLDTTTGQAALYTTTPAWHGLGNVIPDGICDIAQVLRLGGIDFEVERREVRYSFMTDQEDTPTLRTAPDHFVTVRTDTGGALGVVGSKYVPIQNHEIFQFLEDLVNDHGVIWESAGALRGGRKVFVSLRLPETVTIDAEGIHDEIVPFLVMVNSHDASSQAQVVATPWRPVCANTERCAVRDAYSRFGVRHTSGALDRIAEARRALGLTVAYYQEWATEETLLAQTTITLDEFDRLITGLWPVGEDATTRTVNMAARRRDTLIGMFEGEAGRLGRTAYAAERSITDYLDHVAPRRPGRTMTEEIARATALIEGTDDNDKTKTHQRLMTLARR